MGYQVKAARVNITKKTKKTKTKTNKKKTNFITSTIKYILRWKYYIFLKNELNVTKIHVLL